MADTRVTTSESAGSARRRRSRLTIVGAIALLLALRQLVLGVVPASFHSSALLAVVIVVASAAEVWLIYELWRLAKDTAGEPVLLLALLAAIGEAVSYNLWIQIGPSDAGSLSESAGMWIFLLCQLAVALLLGFGLLRSRLVAQWICWVGVAWGVALLILTLQLLPGWPSLVSIEVAAIAIRGLQGIFLAALGVTLMARSASVDVLHERVEQRHRADGAR
jgi:hypothetical protein